MRVARVLVSSFGLFLLLLKPQLLTLLVENLKFLLPFFLLIVRIINISILVSSRLFVVNGDGFTVLRKFEQRVETAALLDFFVKIIVVFDYVNSVF